MLEVTSGGLWVRARALLHGVLGGMGRIRIRRLKHSVRFCIAADVGRAIYALLGLQSFYTAGEVEVRAWPIECGTTAPKAVCCHPYLVRCFSVYVGVCVCVCVCAGARGCGACLSVCASLCLRAEIQVRSRSHA